ncbi:MAG: 2-C-methyl-D-erythritol 4-phosphate cytidylyltransferase [bacterium]|nr:2-C-methyl-D-erythritol 4-phosphate cytidylyltransferase [bacterium]
MKTCALIVAAGASRRLGGDVPKQFREVCGRPLLSWTIGRFEKAESIDEIVVVVAEENLLFTSEKVVDPYGFRKVNKIVPGGESRRESVLKGLERLPISTGLVAIHDGARPTVAPIDIDAVVAMAAAEQSAILAARATDTVKRAEQGYIFATLDRESLFLAQTPQVFGYDMIITAHRELASEIKGAEESGITDDASIVEARGFKVRIVEPRHPNMKVTTADDLRMAELLLRQDNDG